MTHENLSIRELSYLLERKLFNHVDTAQRKELPFITLPKGYSFKVVFPFAGAAMRFHVKKSSRSKRFISVYYDTQSQLGFCCDADNKNIPYWEAYPIGDDCKRYATDDVKKMIKDIVKELNK